jgi:hypothetical protein
MTAKGATAKPCETRAVRGGYDFKRVEPLWSPGVAKVPACSAVTAKAAKPPSAQREPVQLD